MVKLKLFLALVLSLNLLAASVLSLEHYSRANPQFCAMCHVIQPEVDSYLHSNHMDNIHRQAHVGCQDCHTDYTWADKLKSAWRYAWGNYGQTASRRVFDEAMCTRCHISLQYHAARTDFLVHNPHLSHWPDLACGDCHLAHDEQIDYCGYCHANSGHRMTGKPIVPRANNPWARATPTPAP